MAWASLIANKMRSILTMLGIIIGVAAVIALVSIGNGVKQDIQNSISSLGSNLLMVMPGAPRTPGVRPSAGSMKSLKVSDYEAISKLDGVKAASPMTNGSYVVIYQNKNWTTSVSGVSYNYLDVNNWSMKSGRFLSEKNVQNRERVAVVGKTVVKNLFGDEDPVGAEIRVKNIPFRIIGVLNSKGSGAMGNDQDDMYCGDTFVFKTEAFTLEDNSIQQSVYGRMVVDNKCDVSLDHLRKIIDLACNLPETTGDINVTFGDSVSIEIVSRRGNSVIKLDALDVSGIFDIGSISMSANAIKQVLSTFNGFDIATLRLSLDGVALDNEVVSSFILKKAF